jgi:ornithine decarboxylase
MLTNSAVRSALAGAEHDQIIYDLAGIEDQYDALTRELPGVAVRFAIKACPVDEILACLAGRGAGFDAASPNEIVQAIRTDVPVETIHYGNTVKSDRNIATAYRLGVRDFATDSMQDVCAIAAHAPGARVFCRLATTGDGALWGLSGKSGCSVTESVSVMVAARVLGLTPAGLSVHVGSQQMTAEAWLRAFDDLAAALIMLQKHGIDLQYVNLGGGLPALGYHDKQGRPLQPRLDEMFAAIRTGMRRLRQESRTPLGLILEPGRHLVADHGTVRAHVSRLTVRQKRDGGYQHWLYLSCGKFNGLYEMDQLQYRLEFPTHPVGERVPAVVAGPTCDSDDAFCHDSPISAPKALASGDPVWILSSGAYAASYMTVGFNGFDPLPCTTVRRELIGAG